MRVAHLQANSRHGLRFLSESNDFYIPLSEQEVLLPTTAVLHTFGSTHRLSLQYFTLRYYLVDNGNHSTSPTVPLL